MGMCNYMSASRNCRADTTSNRICRWWSTWCCYSTMVYLCTPAPPTRLQRSQSTTPAATGNERFDCQCDMSAVFGVLYASHAPLYRWWYWVNGSNCDSLTPSQLFTIVKCEENNWFNWVNSDKQRTVEWGGFDAIRARSTSRFISSLYFTSNELKYVWNAHHVTHDKYNIVSKCSRRYVLCCARVCVRECTREQNSYRLRVIFSDSQKGDNVDNSVNIHHSSGSMWRLSTL